MSKCGWIEETDFKELENTVWKNIDKKAGKPARELCIYETAFCTECNRCHGTEEEI